MVSKVLFWWKNTSFPWNDVGFGEKDGIQSIEQISNN
jgi:hypothetical protein